MRFFVTAVMFFTALAGAALGDELIIVRSGIPEQTIQPIIDPCPPGSALIAGQCVPDGGVAGTGESCTIADDCPPLDDIWINACMHYECLEQACTLVSNCDPETEACDGSSNCEVHVPRDANITMLRGPETGSFPAPLTPADFSAARNGPHAFLAGFYLDTCVNSVIEDNQARFIDPVSNLTGEPDTTALFAIDFEVTDPAILYATLDIYMRVDDELGGGGNQGIFINGQPLSGDTTGGFCGGSDSMHIHRNDLAPMLQPGTNTLYFNVTRTTDKAGVIFYAEIRVDSDGPAIFHVDDDAAPDGDGISWLTAYDNLEEALIAAEASNDPRREIWLAEGVYKPAVPAAPADPRRATFEMVSGVTIYGGFAGNELVREDRDPNLHESQLNGDLNGNDFLTPTSPSWADNAYSVVTIIKRDMRGMPYLDGVTITHGNADADAGPGTSGGGVYAVADAIIVNSRIVENGGRSGAGIYVTDRVELVNCDVSSNYAHAVFAWVSAEVILTDCRLDGNYAQQGPAVFLWGQQVAGQLETRLRATNSTFTNNTATFNGGAFFNNYRCTIELTDCYVADNRTENNNAGIAHLIRGAQVTATGCTFERNTAGGREGGFHFDESSGVFENCTFRENNGRSSSACIYAFDHCNIEVRNCTFEDNIGANGTAVYASAYTDLIAENSTFERNRGSDYGGALLLGWEGNHTVRNCTFKNNTTRNRGGAVSVSGNASFVNCEFVGNECWGPQPSYWSWGAAVSVADSIVTLENCTVAYNHAGLSAVYATNSLVTVTNSVIRGNTDDNGDGFDSQISGDAASLLTVAYSNVQGITTANGNIDADPLFVELPDDGGDGWTDDNNTMGDLHILPASPCIDAGDTGAVPVETTVDLDGNPRFHDDPGTPDTGTGTPPIVDMGCYEFIRADCNHDGAVDPVDTANFVACLSGPAVALDAGCACFDLTADAALDLADAAAFQRLFETTSVP